MLSRLPVRHSCLQHSYGIHLAKAPAGIPPQGALVLVRGDARGEFQNVAAVLTACKQAGIHDLGITVRSMPAREGATAGRGFVR